MTTDFTFLGYIAALLTVCSGVPQVLRIIRLKESRDISLWTTSILSTGILFWFIYGIMAHDMPVTIANGLSLCVSLTTLYLVVKYR